MKIKATETMYKSQFLNLNETIYQDTKGQTKGWTWAQRPNNVRAVVIAAVVNKGFKKTNQESQYERDLRLVVTKEFRVPIGDYEWGFPAGLVNKDEDPVEAAKRELTEETGLIVKTVLLCGPYVYNTAGMTDESSAMVYVECEGEISKAGHEDSEEIDTFLMSQSEVIKLLGDKDKKFGAKAWIIMNYFASNNSII